MIGIQDGRAADKEGRHLAQDGRNVEKAWHVVLEPPTEWGDRIDGENVEFRVFEMEALSKVLSGKSRDTDAPVIKQKCSLKQLLMMKRLRSITYTGEKFLFCGGCYRDVSGWANTEEVNKHVEPSKVGKILGFWLIDTELEVLPKRIQEIQAENGALLSRRAKNEILHVDTLVKLRDVICENEALCVKVSTFTH